MTEMLIRAIVSFMSGYFLCLSGSLGQLATHNPLSSPSTLGFTGLGVLSVLTSFFIDFMFQLGFSLELLAIFIFLLFFFILVLCFKTAPKRFKNVKNFILLGIVFNLFVGAIFSVVNFIFISKGIQFPSSIWFGNFRYVQLSDLSVFLVLFLVSIYFVHSRAKELEVLNFGDLFSSGLGVNTNNLRLLSLGLSLVLTCFVVIYFGVFSFFGLVLPHVIRAIPYFKYSIRKELKLGPIFAGLVLCLLDYLCYEVTVYGAEFPVGMLSAVFGSLSLIAVLLWSGKVNS